MGHHARLSPSNHRWVHCPASISLEKGYPRTNHPAAVDGTGSHLLLELCIQTKNPTVKATQFLHQTIGEGHEDKLEGWFVDAERCKRVQVALDYLTKRDEELEGVSVTAESKSDIGRYFGRDDWYGTVDVTLKTISPRVVEVIDYKDGFQYVDVNSNSQLIAYAAGKLAPYLYDANGVPTTFAACPVKTIRMTIIQPKITANPVRHITMSIDQLWRAAEELAKKAALTDADDSSPVAGDHCQWCQHKTECVAYLGQNKEGMQALETVQASLPTIAAAIDSTIITDKIKTGDIDVTKMDSETLSKILDAAPSINAMIQNAKEELTTRVKRGESGFGYAMNKGRKAKKWAMDEDTIEKKLKGTRMFKLDDVRPRSFISPAQALKKEGLTERQILRIREELITETTGEPSLVKSKLHAKPSNNEMFGDLQNGGKVDPQLPTVDPTPVYSADSFL